jgi:DNA helicase-2/ATP-dependent DNA helicase PcrA
MAHRIRHLVQDSHVRPNTIQVLMFNSLARKQFTSHLNKVGLPENLQPNVHTFHSFCFHLINQSIKGGLLPASMQYWLADKTELIWLTVKRSITNLEKSKRFQPETIDPEEALSAISLWKGALIPPERAGSYTSPYLPLIYREFENLRLSENALTFDDFIPVAIRLLEENSTVRRRYCQDVQHVIVDEYQDINYGQQRLIELLAGTQADVMVVGDDDQTIYEWRGARPNYILHDFAKSFNSKPVKDYRLSRSFRFGPLIAQCAANVIACNGTRVEKPLIAFQSAKHGYVHIAQGDYGATKELADEITTLIQKDSVSPTEIIVLARMFAQLDNLEAEFLTRRIPYRVDGQEPFFKRQEIKALLDYLRLAVNYRKPLTDLSSNWLLNIANKPSRMLSRSILSKLVSTAKYRRMTMQQTLDWTVDDTHLGLSGWQIDKLADLGGFLEELEIKSQGDEIQAGELLEWMVSNLDYLSYFQNYYGQGEHADEKKFAVINFIRYVTQLHVSPQSLLNHLEKLDTTQGKPEAELIIFTTIFRTKGLEYDYVIIPQCDDNMMPYLKGERTTIYDTAGIVKEQEMSSKEESERRLFYVALTRARKGVLISASNNPSRFLAEIGSGEMESIVNALALLTANDATAIQSLQNSLAACHVKPNFLSNLIYGYLPDMGQQSLAKRLEIEWVLSAPSLGALSPLQTH